MPASRKAQISQSPQKKDVSYLSPALVIMGERCHEAEKTTTKAPTSTVALHPSTSSLPSSASTAPTRTATVATPTKVVPVSTTSVLTSLVTTPVNATTLHSLSTTAPTTSPATALASTATAQALTTTASISTATLTTSTAAVLTNSSTAATVITEQPASTPISEFPTSPSTVPYCSGFGIYRTPFGYHINDIDVGIPTNPTRTETPTITPLPPTSTPPSSTASASTTTEHISTSTTTTLTTPTSASQQTPLEQKPRQLHRSSDKHTTIQYGIGFDNYRTYFNVYVCDHLHTIADGRIPNNTPTYNRYLPTIYSAPSQAHLPSSTASVSTTATAKHTSTSATTTLTIPTSASPTNPTTTETPTFTPLPSTTAPPPVRHRFRNVQLAKQLLLSVCDHYINDTDVGIPNKPHYNRNPDIYSAPFDKSSNHIQYASYGIGFDNYGIFAFDFHDRSCNEHHDSNNFNSQRVDISFNGIACDIQPQCRRRQVCVNSMDCA
ncbi:hypothetical protein COOONC_19118 [Cooperia oncophora]